MIRKNHLAIIGVTLMLSYEYLVLSWGWSKFSVIRWSAQKIFRLSVRSMDLSVLPGHPISYALGVGGFVLMVALLGYSLRKQAPPRWRLGVLSAWLNFHMFCGLLGPILIVFHAHFGAHGLVSISYWSMIVCAVSGIIGSYLYGQTSSLRSHWQAALVDYDNAFYKLAPQLKPPLSVEVMQKVKDQAVLIAGGEKLADQTPINGLELLWLSIAGDLRMKMVNERSFNPPVPRALVSQLKAYGIIRRKSYFYLQYERFLGYWHAFHVPFAVFMYVVAIIHIVVAITFGVHVKILR